MRWQQTAIWCAWTCRANATNRVGSGFSNVQDLQFGPDGALYVSEFNSDLIWRIAPPNCVPQPAGLVSWWSGNGTPEDATGLNDATAMGGLKYADGMVAQAFDLNGSSAFAQVATPAGLPLGSSPRTLALWFKTPRNLSSDTESALFQYGSDANGQMFGLITSANAPGRLYFFGYNRDLAGNTALAANTWYHVAVTYDGTTVTLYLNGQPDGFRAVDLNTTLNANGLTIGYRPGGSRWLGQLDEVMLFDRALAAGEIAAIYAAGGNGVCPPASRPGLTLTRAGEQLLFSWPSQAGIWYQLQSATNLQPAAWLPEGLPLAGTGGVLTTNFPMGPEPQKFFRLQATR